MVVLTMENSLTTTWKAMVFTGGPIYANTQDTGVKIESMELAFLLGQTGKGMMVNLLTS